MIRVGVSALTLVPGVVGGSETAYRALMRAFHEIPDLDVTALLPRIAPDAAEGHPYSVIRSYRTGGSTPARAAAMAAALVGGGRVRREMRLDRFDALHFAFGTMIPEIIAPPAATTIHDLQHEALPDLFSAAERAYRRIVYRRTAQRSAIVIAVSNHAAASIVEFLDVPPDRIRVIPQGVDHAAFTPSTRPREPFLLYPANPWPHKNHERLFEAFAEVRHRHPDIRLVLTGTGHDPSRLPDGVEARGRVSTADLVGLYQSAAALVFPSLYEGFGMPILEAMATGCPVAASDAGSIPEVAADAAVLFDPTSPEAIADGIERVLAEPDRNVAAGYERARQFTWANAAKLHASAYRELAAR